MPKISIVFDRLRTEEKLLSKEASNMGLQVEMIDAKSSRVNTKNTRNDFDFGDAVLAFYFHTRLQRQVCLSQGFLKIQDMLYNVGRENN